MARLDDVRTDSEVADRIRARRGGRLTPLDGMLLHSPPVADGWNSLLGAVRTRTTLSAALRELAILRVAAQNGAAYEWRAHEPVARAAGLGDPQLAALRSGLAREGGGAGPAPAGPAPVEADGADAALTPEQRAALEYTDAMTVGIRVPEPLFARLRAHFDDRQLVELTATIGAYNMVSRFLVALEVGEEGPRGGAGDATAKELSA